MIFYTSLHYFRPQTPPRITTYELAAVIRALHSTANVSADILSGVRLKFGLSIDKDTKDAAQEVETSPGVFNLSSIEYDLHYDAKGCEAMLAPLMQYDAPIYRAEVHLGRASDPICKAFHRTSAGTVDLHLSELRLSIGPIRLAKLDQKTPRHVGWIAMSLSGQGCLFPWSRAEILKRTQQSKELTALADICREKWPVDPHTNKLSDVRGALKRTRRATSKLGVDGLPEWRWDVEETG